MNLLDIKLTASESNWRLFMLRKADPAFLAFQQKILSRDQYTCQFCGFQAKQHMEVINQDNNYLNNRMSNLVTACTLCAQCFFLEAVGKSDFGGGTLIYLPEMTQNELNALCHNLFYSLAMGNANAQHSKNIYRDLKLRSQPIEEELGEGMSNPALYGQLLIDAKNKNKQKLHQDLIPKLRLLPNIKRFGAQIEEWALNGIQALI